MESPPRIFGTPKCKRHKSNHYYDGYSSTTNPTISYHQSPTSKINRQRIKQRKCHSLSSPPRIHRHHSNNNNVISSPLSSRYRQRIGNTSLYDGDCDNNKHNNTKRPMHIQTMSQKRNKKYLSSPISPTFPSPIYNSPSLRNKYKNIGTKSCDRYTPNHGNLNRYNLHSPTKRFVHNNNNNMMPYHNVISAKHKKRRKLGQNYSGTNDDPSSLNHRLKQKLSQHTYNQVLQSELLGFSAEYTNICNQVFSTNDNSDDTQKNDNISNIQMDSSMNEDDTDTDTNTQIEADVAEFESNIIYMSPTLPNRRMRRQETKKKVAQSDDESDRERNETINSTSHHPLCPCFNHNGTNENYVQRDDNSLNSDIESDADQIEANNQIFCVCDSITSNVATNFLVSPQRTLRYDNNQENECDEYNEMNERNGFAMTPIKPSSQSQLSGSRKSMRNIAKSPFKVLDAPRLTDDFYLNLVDWSSSCNILSVGLGECVYLWSAYTSKVTKLVDLTELFKEYPQCLAEAEDITDGYDMVCSVGWSKNHESALNHCIKGNEYNAMSSSMNMNMDKALYTKEPTCSDYLAVGSGSGYVFVFDTVKSKMARRPLMRHNHRVGVIAWKDNNVLTSGSRDRNIYLRDIRINDNKCDMIQQLKFHKQEVCGLKWSEDSLYLASGGNDNKLAIWDIRYSHKPLCYGKHKAAVKAITWSPHDSGLIASGGGTADRCIKFWNVNSFISASNKDPLNASTRAENGNPFLLKPIEVIDTGSQVCNLLWSKNVNEIVSTHGYSLNQIVVWKYPTMDKIVTLTGHTYRVLYLAGSPDGQTVVTGAGDETLRLWNIFPPNNQSGNDAMDFVPQSYSIPLHIR